jgi:hypothetical protein
MSFQDDRLGLAPERVAAVGEGVYGPLMTEIVSVLE